jgi:AcrR family transcriptional regulator
LAVRLRLKRKPKRKAGSRAGLTRAIIAAAAARRLETDPGKFSLRELAKSLGVVPTSVRSHFAGGVLDLFDEVVRAALNNVARPYLPNEEAPDYLAELFFAILKSLHGKPTIAILAVQHLSANPVLVPLLAERILVSLSALGASKETAPKLFTRTLGLICEMIVSECVRSKAAAQENSSKKVDAEIGDLPQTEYSGLVELRKGLVAEIKKGASVPPTPELARSYVARLVAMVGASQLGSRRTRRWRAAEPRVVPGIV